MKRKIWNNNDFVYELDGETFMSSDKNVIWLTRCPTERESDTDVYPENLELKGDCEDCSEIHPLVDTYSTDKYIEMSERILKQIKKLRSNGKD